MYIVIFAFNIDYFAFFCYDCVKEGDTMAKNNVFADFIHADNVIFKHANGMRDIFGLELHPFYELFLFLGGDAEFISGDFRTVLEKNSLVIIPKESFHHFVVHGPEEEYHRYVLNFTPFGKLKSLIEEKMSDICIIPADDEMMSHFDRLARHASDGDQYKKELLLEAALTDILLLIDQEKNGKSNSAFVAINPSIARAVKYINGNVCKISRMEEIAAEVNLSPSYFAHLFKKELHISPNKYLLEKKLVMANRMIDSGIGAVSAAAQCGFADYSGFYKMYKKAFGVAPSKTKSNK